MRILLLNQNHIGDALFTTPAIAALREAMPDAHIVNAAVRAVESIFSANRRISERWLRPTTHWWDYLTFLFRVRRGRFDAVVSLSASSTLFGVYARYSGAPLRVGFRHRAMERFVTHTVHLHDVGRHHVLDHFEQMAVIAPIRRDLPIEFHLLPQWRDEAAGVLCALGLPAGRPLVGLNPGASMERKMWPVDRWAAVSERLHANGFQPVLFGGPRDRVLVERVEAGCSVRIPSTQGRLSLGALAAAAASCSAFVSADTGPMHVAAAVGTPVIALHGPTDPSRTGPYTKRAVVIHHAETGLGDEIFGRMETITVDEVDEAVRSVMS